MKTRRWEYSRHAQKKRPICHWSPTVSGKNGKEGSAKTVDTLYTQWRYYEHSECRKQQESTEDCKLCVFPEMEGRERKLKMER